jgi:hypothetical protein
MKKKVILKITAWILMILFALILLLFIIRYFSPIHLDDLHPNIPCDEELIKKSSYLSVIPKYNNESIANNKEWCSYIKSFNKSLVIHGVYHTYNEFYTPRDVNYISEGKEIFINCFNFSPSEFKAPQLALSKENEHMLKEKFNLKIYTKFNQIFHKVYHCNDSGVVSNRINDLV